MRLRMTRPQRTIAILAGAIAVLMLLFLPFESTITFDPMALGFTSVPTVEEIRERLRTPERKSVAYRFAGTIARDSNAYILVDGTASVRYTVAWSVFLENLTVLAVIAGAAYLIAAPSRSGRK